MRKRISETAKLEKGGANSVQTLRVIPEGLHRILGVANRLDVMTWNQEMLKISDMTLKLGQFSHLRV